LGKLASFSRAITQQQLTDGSDSEPITNGEQSSPYMSNAVNHAPASASMAPIGDGVSLTREPLEVTKVVRVQKLFFPSRGSLVRYNYSKDY